MKSLKLTFLALLILQGCGAPHRIDATDRASIQKSLDQAEKQLFAKDVKAFKETRKKFEAIYFQPGGPPPGYPDIYAINSMTASEFNAFVKDIGKKSRQDRIAEFASQQSNFYPAPAITQRLLEQYQLEKTLTDISRDVTWLSGKNTIDQYPITDTTVIVPPVGEVPVTLDKVRFLITWKNMSGFDAYQPTFRVTVNRPGQGYPVFQETFTDPKSKKDVIRPYQEITQEYTCCGIASDPYNNKLFKAMPEDAEFVVDVVSIKNAKNSELLNTETFTIKENSRIAIVDACIKHLSENLKTWVPPKSPDEGECGQLAAHKPNQDVDLQAGAVPLPSTTDSNTPATPATTNTPAPAPALTQVPTS